MIMRTNYEKRLENLHSFMGGAVGSRADADNIDKILLELSGAPGEHEWHWILLLRDGRHAYATAKRPGPGSTSDISTGSWSNAETLEEALSLVPEDEQCIMRVMLKHEEPVRSMAVPGVSYSFLRANEMFLDLLHLNKGRKNPDDTYIERLFNVIVATRTEPMNVQATLALFFKTCGINLPQEQKKP